MFSVSPQRLDKLVQVAETEDLANLFPSDSPHGDAVAQDAAFLIKHYFKSLPRRLLDFAVPTKISTPDEAWKFIDKTLDPEDATILEWLVRLVVDTVQAREDRSVNVCPWYYASCYRTA